MNGKFILIFFLACNIFSVIFSFGCVENGVACNIGNDGFITTFIVVPAVNFNALGGYVMEVGFVAAITSMVTPFSGGTSSGATGFTVFLDALKMSLGMLTLLTPIPMLDFVFSMGFAIWVNVLLWPLVSVLYLMSIAEFVRGSQIGR